MPALTLILLLSIGLNPAPSEAQTDITLNMADGWIRRDWQECRDPSIMSSDGNRIRIETDSSAVLYWQVPTKTGPLSINRDQNWIQECDRPPQSFARTIARGQNRDHLLDVTDYRYFSWNWKVNNTIDDWQTVDKDGRIQPEGDDFAAKIGISILKKGSDKPREISYIWTHSLPEDSVIIHEKRIIFWRFQYHRIVAESGDARVGQWVSETRDLYADYKRIYPNEEPGEIVRIYVMSDSDNTDSEVTGHFADLQFTQEPPRNLTSSSE